MNVRLGWSGDIHGTWTKMDVEVEEADFDLHFSVQGITDVRTVTPVEKFKLMYVLAEIFVQLHKMSRFPDVFGTDKDRAELADLISQRDKLTALIVEREGVLV